MELRQFAAVVENNGEQPKPKTFVLDASTVSPMGELVKPDSFGDLAEWIAAEQVPHADVTIERLRLVDRQDQE